MKIIFAIAFGSLVVASWLIPGSTCGAVLCVAATLVLVLQSRLGLRKRDMFLAGCIIYGGGFYWLATTIKLFGGFPSILAWLIFALFVAASSLQFSLFAWVHNKIEGALPLLGLPVSWCAVEFLYPRIFPWEISHPLLGIPELTQVADVGGSMLVTFFLVCSLQLLVHCFRKPSVQAVLSLLALVATWWSYGWLSIRYYEKPALKPAFTAAMIQANISIEEKGDLSLIHQNKEAYVELSKGVPSDVDLLIWPESVVQDWIFDGTKKTIDDPRLPDFSPNKHLLTGALTFLSQKTIYNSALMLTRSGEILPSYHKRILMPFGEYMPFANILPFLNTLNANLALFTPGENTEVYELPFKNGTRVRLAPLICYEDLLPSLANEAVQKGAEVLVNLTNDAWFGRSLAPAHHNMIASFRAIETRRFLIRSTNTGLTSVVDPIGRTLATLPQFSDGVLITDIFPRSERTVFVQGGLIASWLFSLAVVGSCVLMGVAKLKKSSDSPQ